MKISINERHRNGYYYSKQMFCKNSFIYYSMMQLQKSKFVIPDVFIGNPVFNILYFAVRSCSYYLNIHSFIVTQIFSADKFS